MTLRGIFVKKEHGTEFQHLWQRRILLLCWLTYALSYLCRTNLSVALPEMTKEFHWSASLAGLIGSVFFVTYGAGHLLGGIIGDHIPPKKLICAGLFGTSICNLLMGTFPVYAMLLLTWAVNGLFLSMIWGPVVRIIAIWYPPADRNTPAVLVTFSSLAGYMISWAGLGILSHYTSWEFIFFLPGIVTLLFSFWFFWKMNDQPTSLGLINYSSEGTQNTKTETTVSGSITFWTVIRKNHLLFFCLAASIQGIIKDGITLWAPSILTSFYHSSQAVISLASSLIPLFSMPGVFLAGWLIDKSKGREKQPALLLFGATAGCVLLLFLEMGSWLWLDVVLFGLISSLLYGINTILLTFLPLRFASAGRTSSVAGLLNFSAYLGAGCSGILSGAMTDRFGWNSTILLWTILCVVGIFSIAAGNSKKESHKA